MTSQPTHKLVVMLALSVAVVSATATMTAQLASARSRVVRAVNIGVYWDSGCTNTTSTINWGMLWPSTSTNVTLYVRNAGNTAVTISLTTNNWNPTKMSNYMGLAWNGQGQTVKAGSVLAVTLTLSVYSNATGITNVSFDTVITSTGR